MHNVLIILARLVIQFENWKYKNYLMLISILETTCHIPMSYAAPQWAMPHPNELRHTPLSYATP